MVPPERRQRSGSEKLPRLGPVPLALLLACFALWAFQAWRYAFLCDDAFISFRYARNLAEGAGLVFNPGYERVEGYSNFLWVLLLAAGAALGMPPERLANPLLLGCGLGLLWRVLRHAREQLPQGMSPLWLAFPLAALALNRSFAVWSTSGLETRLFELFAVGGVLAADSELRSARQGRALFPHSSLWLAGAALTRPDGLLIAACVLAARAGLERARRQFAWPAALRAIAIVVLPVAAQLLFRWLYYGDLVPNTYHAKVGGRSWWSLGSLYLVSFALEYAAWFWLPLLAAGAAALLRAGRSEFPLLCAAVVLPHALYLASIGGDHFEYRPLDLYLPLGALLAFHGACALQRRAARFRTALPLAALALLAVSNLLPELAHRDHPPGYRTGFPGETPRDDYRAELIDTRARAGLLRIPGVHAWVAALNAVAALTTQHFVGVRQEEHAAFLATAEQEARWLRESVDAGLIPADTFLAIDSVGAIPYRTRLRTLDRLGLTDRRVAREGKAGVRRSMGHEKQASEEYRFERRVDLDAAHAVYPILPAGHPRLLLFGHRAQRLRQPYMFARLPEGRFLVVAALAGEAVLRERFPHLAFEPAAGLVEIALAGGNCGPPVPRALQLDEPYDQIYVEQSKSLWNQELRPEAHLHNRCALLQRPSNPAARLREQSLAW